MSKRATSFLAGSHLPHSIALFAMALLASCSFNQHGTARQEIIQAQGGVVEKFEAFGLHLDTQRDPFSITLGKYESQRVFSGACEGATQAPANLSPELRFSIVKGLGVTINSDETGVSIGYRERLRMRPVGPADSTSRRIFFDPRKPEATIVDTDSFENSCGVR